MMFPQKVSSAVFIIWGFSFISKKCYEFFKEKKFITSSKKERIASIGLLLFFLLSLASVFYTADFSLTINRVFGSRLSLLIFPLFIFLGIGSVDFNKLLKYFILGNFILILYSLGHLVYLLLISQEIELYRNFLFYATESCNSIMHRSYAGMNILISYIAIFYLWDKSCKTDRINYIFYSILAFGFILINNSRTITLLLLILLILLGYYYIFKHNSLRNRILIFLVFFIGTGLFFTIPNRTNRSLHEYISNKTINDSRSIIWKEAINLIKEKPMLGYGVNNTENVLINNYKNINYSEGIISEFNPHNQYLTTLLELGIIGFAIFLFVLLSIPFISNKPKTFTIPLAIVFGISFLFESMLDRYSGCITFGFFFTLLTAENKETCQSTIIEKPSVPLISGIFILILIACIAFSKKDPIMLINQNLFTHVNNEINEKYEIPADVQYIRFLDNKKDKSVTLNNYEIFYKMFAIYELENEYQGHFNIRCFVSKDFNGKWVKLISEEDLENQTNGIAEYSYDMNRKGEWQTLGFDINDKRQTLLYYVAYPVEETKNKCGYVIFADPVFTDLSPISSNMLSLYSYKN